MNWGVKSFCLFLILLFATCVVLLLAYVAGLGTALPLLFFGVKTPPLRETYSVLNAGIVTAFSCFVLLLPTSFGNVLYLKTRLRIYSICVVTMFVAHSSLLAIDALNFQTGTTIPCLSLILFYMLWEKAKKETERGQEEKVLAMDFPSLVNKDSEKIGCDSDDRAFLVEKAKQVTKDIENPKEASFWLIANMLIPELAHGSNHIYRGSLSLRGQHLYRCIGKLISFGVENRIITAEEAENMRANLRQSIADAG